MKEVEMRIKEEYSLSDLMDATEFHYLKHEIILPDGYEFRDENGNVIEAKKIVLEKINTLKI